MGNFRFSLAVLLTLSVVAAEDEVVIGTSAAFQGPSRGLGIELYRGAGAYFAHVNAQGGVNGRQIVVRARDDGYNPIPCIRNTVELVESDNVLLLFGYVGTPTVTRALPLLKKYEDRGVLLFFPFTGAQPQREPPYDDLVFNLRASYRQETKGLVDHFVEAGRKRIAVFYQVDAYGRSGQDGVKRALGQHGLQIVAEATYRRGTRYEASLSEQVQILRRGEPDAVISIGAYAACAAFIRDARLAGWDAPIANVSFVGSESMLALLLATGKEKGTALTRGLVNSQVVPSYEDTSLPAVREYRELMGRYAPAPPQGIADATYVPLQYSFVSLEGFLNAKLLVEVLKRAGPGADRAGIRRAAEGIDKLDLGLDVPVSFGPGRHQGFDRVYYTTVRDGKFVPVEDWAAWRKP